MPITRPRRLIAELEDDLRDFGARLAEANRTDLWLGGRRIPRDRWASYRTLVDRLWAGDPPEIAEQAMRMAAGGLDRDVIFDKLIIDTSIGA